VVSNGTSNAARGIQTKPTHFACPANHHLLLCHNDPDLAAEVLDWSPSRSKATDFTTVTFGHVLPSCDGKSALAAQARVIAKRLLRNIAVKQSCIFGNFSPDSQRAARATCLFARGPRDKGLFDQAQ
jgi:hypothetical protein